MLFGEDICVMALHQPELRSKNRPTQAREAGEWKWAGKDYTGDQTKELLPSSLLSSFDFCLLSLMS